MLTIPILVVFFGTKKTTLCCHLRCMSICSSSVEISLERGSKRSANLCNLQFFANKFVCTVLTDLLTQFAEN